MLSEVNSYDGVVGDSVGKECRCNTSLVDDGELHVVDFLVDALDELEDKVYQLFLLELCQVLVCNQETEVVIIECWLLSHDLELVSSEGEEPLEHVGEQYFDLLVLLDGDAHSHGVDTRLHETSLLLTLRY